MPDLTPIPGATPTFDDDGNERIVIATCGTCGRSWNDAAVSAVTPAPAARCPFEYEHDNDDDDILRDVAIPHPLIDGAGPYRLTLRDGGYAYRGRYGVRYTFRAPDGSILFEGSDYTTTRAIDSDQTIRDLLGFLTLRPGDTDPDYFDAYTPAQLAWADSYECECLQVLADDDDETTFEDWNAR